MNYCNKIFFFILLLYLIISCKQSNENQFKDSTCNSKIDSISVIYYNSLFKPFNGVRCESLIQTYIPDFENEDEGILDAVITDCNILKDIDQELLLLTPSNTPIIENMRIKANIHYKNKVIKKICIGNIYASLIFLDGIPQSPNNKLLYLIKNILIMGKM